LKKKDKIWIHVETTNNSVGVSYSINPCSNVLHLKSIIGKSLKIDSKFLELQRWNSHGWFQVANYERISNLGDSKLRYQVQEKEVSLFSNTGKLIDKICIPLPKWSAMTLFELKSFIAQKLNVWPQCVHAITSQAKINLTEGMPFVQYSFFCVQ